jgi:hypothetical protein
MSNVASNSWRLSVLEKDRSSTVRGEASNVGAMVIRASKGTTKPIKISVGQEQRIIDLFGKPSSSYPDVWEAIQYNYQDDIWISAPYADDALLGGVLIKDLGTEAVAAGQDPDTVSTYSFNSDDEYMAIFSKSPHTDDLAIQVTYNSSNDRFTISLYKTEDGGTTYSLLETYTVSVTEGTLDGFGKNIYVEEVLENNDYIQVVVNSGADTSNGFVDDASKVAFVGGDRGSAITVTELTTGWNYFQKIHSYPAKIFMDPTSVDGVQDIFVTLRNTYQKYAFYIFALPGAEDVDDAITTFEGYGLNNSGLAAYWNRGKVKDTYNNSSFWTSLIGPIGAKLAAMDNIFNGGAPAWRDENNHGGQLSAGIIELEYDPTESQLESLDQAGINPIVFYPGYGYMIASHRTCQSPNNLSDNSWIAHRRLFDYIISNILNQVLTYQIVKLNDELHRRLAVSKGITIMDPILSAGLLSDYIIQCDRNNNTDKMLAQRKFIYTVALKVTPYSEEVVLEFINVGQNTEVSEVIA